MFFLDFGKKGELGDAIGGLKKQIGKQEKALGKAGKAVDKAQNAADDARGRSDKASEKAEMAAWYYKRDEIRTWRQHQVASRPAPAEIERGGQKRIEVNFGK